MKKPSAPLKTPLDGQGYAGSFPHLGSPPTKTAPTPNPGKIFIPEQGFESLARQGMPTFIERKGGKRLLRPLITKHLPMVRLDSGSLPSYGHHRTMAMARMERSRTDSRINPLLRTLYNATKPVWPSLSFQVFPISKRRLKNPGRGRKILHTIPHSSVAETPLC